MISETNPAVSFVRANDGIRLAYNVTGEGKPVLLIHGFASSRVQNWGTTGWIDRLAQEGYRVVSFDCRGHGLSDKPHDPDSYGRHMARDILTVMHATALPAAHVMGYSMGAMLTIDLVMRHPERVLKAVVAGLGANYFDEQQDWRDKVATALLTDDPSLIEDNEARKFRIFGGQKGKDRVALAACMRSPRSKYTPGELKTAKPPVLVVAGETDTLVGSPFGLATAFGDGRAAILPNKDHMTAVGDPGYKRAVLDFLAA